MKRFIKHAGAGRDMRTSKRWGDKPATWTKKENNKSIRQFVKKLEWF